MSEMKTVLISLSDEQCNCGRVDLRRLMAKAIKTEQLMESKVLIEEVQKRYNTFCDRIEFYSHRLLSLGSVDSEDLGGNYLDLLVKIKDRFPEESMKSRLTANFCPKERMAGYISDFESLVSKVGISEREEIQKKLSFYRRALSENKNVVELLVAWTSIREIDIETDTSKLEESFLSLNVSDNMTSGDYGGHFVALKNQFNKVIDLTKKKTHAAINFSELRHDVITKVIREYAYKNGTPMYVAVTYADGSEASPLPIYCLRSKLPEQMVQLNAQPILNVGMMSARHANDGLDALVKTYWYRNQEISIGRTQAETDDVAYKKSKELFFKLRSEGPYRIAFYQTGFQPAVVGFYRALIEELIERNKKKMPADLEVIPYFFMGEYIKGEPWN